MRHPARAPFSRLLLAATLLSLGLAAVTSRASDHGHTDEGDAEHDRHGTIVLSAAQREALGLAVTTIGPGRVDSGIELLGEIHPNGDRLAHIVPRFPGIVRDVRRTAGDVVHSGDVLAVIESSDSLAPYELKTLIDGVVLTKHLTRGEAVDRETQAFVVADLSTVWVDLSIYQKDLTRVRVGQEVRIHAVQGGPDALGTISYLTPAVDRVTRTAVARVVLPNPGRRWLPGMFVTSHTLDPREAPLVAPRSAIQILEGEPTVFVEDADGFVARPVALGQEGETLVEIVGGVTAGDRIATRNTFLLKAEAAKGEAEHEH